jgi:putative glutamine amidotransferase
VKKSLVLLVLSLLCQSLALAKIRLVEWHTKSTLAPLIIPVRESETPKEASQRYLKNLSQNPGLMELFQGQAPQIETLKFVELNPKDREARTLLMANLPKDTTKNSVRVEKFKFYFQKNQQKSFILPINANLGLNLLETREFFAEVAEKFPMLVVMGGEDVDPALYKKENFHAGNTSPERDLFEIALIKSYVTSAKGFLLGVCRGSQIASVAMGYELLQDIPFHVEKNVGHSHTWHDIRVLPTENSILKNILSESNVWNVNSEHHQMAKITASGPLQVAARADDGVIEASEFKNGRGLLLQFHPELMENNVGFRILTGAVKAKNRVMPRLCSRIFSS